MSDSNPTTSATGALVAEAIGTFILVLALVSAAVFWTEVDTGTGGTDSGTTGLRIAFAAGLALTAAVGALGPISGGHFNPAVTLGLAAAGRFPWSRTAAYVIAQVVGGAVATTVVVLIGLFGPDQWLATAQDRGFASNGWGDRSAAGFGVGAAIAVEIVFTAVLVAVVLGATRGRRRARTGSALVIGSVLAAIHLATIPIDGTSVNPARSIATALYGGGDALAQVWVFIAFPVVGGLLAGLAYRALFGTESR